MGIQYFEKGDDLDAMDRFMDVLTKGDPGERSMANDYINLLTRRMNVDDKGAFMRRPQESAPAVTSAPALNVPSPSVPAGTAVQAPPAPSRQAPSAMPAGPSKEVMRLEIEAKLRERVDDGLARLRKIHGVRLLVMSNGQPQALGIPSSLLFHSGIVFQRRAGTLLRALADVVFGLGGAQVEILPQGTADGDAKILDMRRTMGISAYLFSAGVAPPRVSVNLLNTQVDIPRPLLDFKGIIVLFQYDQPLRLAVDSAIGDEAGPPISLGIYPDTIRPAKGEGAVIEFSVQDSPSRLVSWRFQLLSPEPAGGSDLSVLQEVVGDSPVFHQIYWNGHRNYFGPMLPAGSYEAVLTATDGKNRQRTLHRWIHLLAAPPPARAARAKTRKKASRASGAPEAELPSKGSRASLIKERLRHRRISRRHRRARHKSLAGKHRPIAIAANGYELAFKPGSHQLTSAGGRLLARIARILGDHPKDGLLIKGFAQSSEANAAHLADARAKLLAGLLVNKYQIDPKKIQLSSSVTDEPGSRARVTFVKEP